VEFADADTAASFQPPAWFGAEVTDDVRYRNRSLAMG
jgi:CYTH domain-containing protein